MTDTSPYTPPTAELDQGQLQPQSGTSPWLFVAAVAVVSLLTGIGDGLLQQHPLYGAYYLVTIIVFAGLAIGWYYADAKSRGRPRSPGMAAAIVLLAIIAIPVYLFRSRGAGKGALATVLFLLFILGCGALSTFGTALVLGLEGV